MVQKLSYNRHFSERHVSNEQGMLSQLPLHLQANTKLKIQNSMSMTNRCFEGYIRSEHGIYSRRVSKEGSIVTGRSENIFPTLYSLLVYDKTSCLRNEID